MATNNPYDKDMDASTASPVRTALENSRLTSGKIPPVSGTGHQVNSLTEIVVPVTQIEQYIL
jgi:hypothetical protein